MISAEERVRKIKAALIPMLLVTHAFPIALACYLVAAEHIASWTLVASGIPVLLGTAYGLFGPRLPTKEEALANPNAKPVDGRTTAGALGFMLLGILVLLGNPAGLLLMMAGALVGLGNLVLATLFRYWRAGFYRSQDQDL